jgi:hypothetical protein
VPVPVLKRDIHRDSYCSICPEKPVEFVLAAITARQPVPVVLPLVVEFVANAGDVSSYTAYKQRDTAREFRKDPERLKLRFVD